MQGDLWRGLLGRIERFSAALGEDQSIGIGGQLEIKHVVQRARDGVERSRADTLPFQPVVFHEANDGALIGEAVIDGVLWRRER